MITWNMRRRLSQPVITGQGQTDNEKRQYLYRGIAGRSFERRFQVAEHVKVADARMENGLLQINLVRELPRRYGRGRSLSARICWNG